MRGDRKGDLAKRGGGLIGHLSFSVAAPSIFDAMEIALVHLDLASSDPVAIVMELNARMIGQQ